MNWVLDINPRHVEALTVAAGILDGARRRDEAGALYERALAVEPENRFLRLNYAANRAASGRMAEAVAEYERLVADHPGDPVLLEYLGVAHGVAGDAAASVAALEKAAGIRASPSLYINLAMAYKAAGNVDGAIRSLRRYLENPHGESEAAVAAARAELAALERERR
jgi:tetratricopeptide (TPR) repeat protein